MNPKILCRRDACRDKFKTKSFPYIPEVTLKELLRRNIKRLLTTGRYVPVRTIIETVERVRLLMKRVVDNITRNVTQNNHSTPVSKLKIDKTLANLAGYYMYNDRTVVRISKTKDMNHRNVEYYFNQKSTCMLTQSMLSARRKEATKRHYSDETYINITTKEGRVGISYDSNDKYNGNRKYSYS